MNKDSLIYFLGGGAMAEALIKGLLEKKVMSPEQIGVTDIRPDRCHELREKYAIITEYPQKAEHLMKADIVVLAFKPKDLDSAMDAYGRDLRSKQLVISVLAGVTTQRLEEFLPAGTPLVRAMPNTAAAVGLSATAICGGKQAQEAHLAAAEALFAATGIVQRVAEPLMDAVTGLSGSGPAYVYLLAEAMLAGGVAAGLDLNTARALTEQTLLGAAHMLQASRRPPEELRKQVSSPGGTTLAGLEALAEYHFAEAVQEAILRATRRSQTLSKIVTTGTN